MPGMPFRDSENNLSICIRCHGSLISWGEKSAAQDESTAPGMPERERQESNDDTEEVDGDVEMEKDEIDRLVRETNWPRKRPTMTWTCLLRSRASQHPDWGVGALVLHQIHRQSLAARRKNSRRRKMSAMPRNRNKMKNKGNPKSNYLFGQREQFKDQSFTASTSLRMKMRLTVPQGR